MFVLWVVGWHTSVVIIQGAWPRHGAIVRLLHRSKHVGHSASSSQPPATCSDAVSGDESSWANKGGKQSRLFYGTH